MTNAEYLASERRRARDELARLASQSLGDRRETRAAYRAMLLMPDVLEVRLGFLLDGNYGQGALILAEEALDATRGNRAAQLSVLVAGFECMCPSRFARDAYRSLNRAQRIVADAVFEHAMASADEEHAGAAAARGGTLP